MKGIRPYLALTAALVLFIGVSSALSQGKSSSPIQNRQGIVDANGDGICDITGQKIGSGAAGGQGQQVKRGNQNGPGDGTGNQRKGPQDGTGYGSKSGQRTGPQDGTQARIGQMHRTGAGGTSAGNRARRGGKR